MNKCKMEDKIIDVKHAGAFSDKFNESYKCRRAKKIGQIDIVRWYSHRDKGDFFIVARIDSMEFRSVLNYPLRASAETAANNIKAYLFRK